MITQWKSSTVLVAAAFGLSVLLLFLKAGMMHERATADRPLITNHVYSPAAADPELRDQRAAERITARPAVDLAPATRAVVVREPVRTPARQRVEASTPPRRTAAATPTTTVAIPEPYHVVTATFSAREKAERGVADLKRKGFAEAFVGVFDGGKYYSVIARRFDREDQARVMLSELKSKYGVEAIIWKKVD